MLNKILNILDKEIFELDKLNDNKFHLYEIKLSHALFYLKEYQVFLTNNDLIDYVISLIYIDSDYDSDSEYVLNRISILKTKLNNLREL